MKKLLLILFIPNLLFGQDLDLGHFRSFLDTITFDKIEKNIHIDSSSKNIWQIAHPQKTFLNNSYSDSIAILTDSINFYTDSNYSYFDLYLSPQIYKNFYHGAFYISFKHKMDSDTLKDGGYLSYSRDLGQSWFNITEDTAYACCVDVYPNDNNINLYNDNDLLYNGENGFSGHFDWKTTEFTWHYIPVKGLNYSDTTILRFNFISDSINNNKEGWLIDDILIYYVNIPGSTNEKLESNFIIYPNPTSEEITILFNEIQTELCVKIYNQLGEKIIENKYINRSKILINIDLIPGVYNLVVEKENKKVNSKTLIFN